MISKFLFRPKVPVVFVRNSIDVLEINRISSHISSYRFRNIKAFAIVFCTRAGILHATDALLERIKTIKQRHAFPIYVFAENHCSSSRLLMYTGAYHVMACADKSYIMRHTLIELGIGLTDYNFNKLTQQLGIQSRCMTSCENLMEYQLDFLKNHSKSQVIQVQRRMNKLAEQRILQKRGTKLNMNQFNMRKTYFGEEAVKAGLVDGIGSCQAILNEHFPECKIVQYHIYPANELEGLVTAKIMLLMSPIPSIIVFLLLLKLAAKCTLIIYAWIKKNALWAIDQVENELSLEDVAEFLE